MKRIDAAREAWVGFAASPRSRAGAKAERIEAQLTAPGGIAQHLQRFISASGLASWLASTTKFDARLGAKLCFALLAADVMQQEDELPFGGTYTSLVVPKQITLTTERHGEVVVSLRDKRGVTEISIRFSSSLLPDEVETWQRLAGAALDRLRAQIDADAARAGSR